MQDLNLHEEAIVTFNTAKFLDPLNLAPIVYSIKSFRLLKDDLQEKAELKLLESALETLNDQALWKNRLAT